MDVTENGEEASRLVEVRFVTKLQQALKVPTRSMKVPSQVTRMGLSEIINHLLHAVDFEFQPLPFDFIIEGELIRMPLEQFLLTKGISAEKVLEIEYIKAVVPRTQQDPCPHDDWVSAIDGSNSSFILTGCYDNRARVWKNGSSCTHILEGHSDAITSVCILDEKGTNGSNSLRLVTASKDQSLRLWKMDADVTMDGITKLSSFKTFNGHKKSVQSISADPSRNMVCSGSWDCSIKLWSVEDESEDDLVIKKRRVHDDDNDDMVLHEGSQMEGTAITTLAGHTQCVSAVVWPERETLYSASWDHSIRIWDVQSQKDTWNMVCGKALNCLDVGGESAALVVAGGSDPILRVWDPRKPGTLSPVFQFSSHTSWISACKWHKRSWFHLLSASYDGKVMLWDLRTAWPLTVINSHTDKVLCADWWKDDSVISGSADSNLSISSGFSIY